MSGHNHNQADGARVNPFRAVKWATESRLTEDQAVDSARDAWRRAKRAQLELATDGALTRMLHRPDSIRYHHLKSARAEAKKQADRAVAVLAALDEAVESFERTRGEVSS